MKLLKLGLRFWLTLTSVVSFIAGWVMLAHAPKPNQENSLYSGISSQPLPTLAPLAPLSDFNNQKNDNSFWFNSQSPDNTFRPTFRTGGS